MTVVPVCMICQRELAKPGNEPLGEELPKAENQSHGICNVCLPAYCVKLGLNQADTQRLLDMKFQRP